MCEVETCDRPVNRDGLCLPHKLKTIQFATGAVTRERQGVDATGGMGTRKYVEDMFETRRRAGLPDPEPENSKAAVYAPKQKVFF